MSKKRPGGIKGRNVQIKLVTKLYKKFVEMCPSDDAFY